MEITEQRKDELINRIAYRVVRHGLVAPAIAFLELNRPLMNIYSQGMHFVSPVVDTLFGHPYATEAGYIFQKDKNIDCLLEQIEKFDKLRAQGKDISKLI